MKLSRTNNNCSVTKLSRLMLAQQTVNVIVRACTLGSTDQHNSECMMDFPPGTPSDRVMRIYAWLDWEGVLEYFEQTYYVSRIAIRG